MSDTTSRAPPRARRVARREPTCPSPTTAIERPRSERPHRALERHADRRLDAERGGGAGIARAAQAPGEAGDVRRALGDHLHVAAGHAHVLGGEVAPLQVIHHVGEVQEGGAAPGAHERAVSGPHDHALAASQRQSRDRGLERHGPREPQHVADRGARASS